MLFDNGLAFKDLALRGKSSLNDVLLNVMNDVLVDLTMDDRLHLNYAVLSDSLLDDGCPDDDDMSERTREVR